MARLDEMFSDEMLTDNTGISNCAQCEECVHNDGGDMFSDRWSKACCAMYMHPDHKPVYVIVGSGQCALREVRR